MGILTKIGNALTRNAWKKITNYYGIHGKKEQVYADIVSVVGGGLITFGIASYLKQEYRVVNVYSFKDMQRREDLVVQKISPRERRFFEFSSVEFDGQIYMTPQDFIESVVEMHPRPRLKRQILKLEDIENFYKDTPPVSQSSPRFFRDMRDKGIISFTEYLFLLTILTKAHSGFTIALHMFDTDGNHRVDDDEYKVILKILGRLRRNYKIDEDTIQILIRLVGTEEEAKRLYELEEEQKRSWFSRLIKGKDDHQEDEEEEDIHKNKTNEHTKDKQEEEDDKSEKKEEDDSVHSTKLLPRLYNIKTTLESHFFKELGYAEFDQMVTFLHNLQDEVLEMEFFELSKGDDNTITEADFAMLVFRYAFLDSTTYDESLERVLQQGDGTGISFKEFCDFARFLLNLDDFQIAMQMYELADKKILTEDFERAVRITTGYHLKPNLIKTLFAMFDEHNTGTFSYQDFIVIMRDRQKRGFGQKLKGLSAFKNCVRLERKRNNL